MSEDQSRYRKMLNKVMDDLFNPFTDEIIDACWERFEEQNKIMEDYLEERKENDRDL